MRNETLENVVVYDLNDKYKWRNSLKSVDGATLAFGGLLFYALYRICGDSVKGALEKRDKEFQNLSRKVLKRLDKMEKEQKKREKESK